MKVTLVTVGTRGDVQPMLALGQTLQQRGHTVKIAAPPNFAKWITDHGFAFAPVGADKRQYLQNNPDALSGSPIASYRFGKHFFGSQLPVHVRDIEAACEGTDAIVWAGLAIAATIVAEKMKLPILNVFYSSCLLPSDQHPPPSCPRHGLPSWANRLLWSVNGFFGNLVVGGLFNRARASVGLPPVNFSELMPRSDHVIAADPVLFPHDPQWGANVRSGNFIFYNDPRPLDPALEAWLDEGEAPIFIGFGSMSGPGTQRIEKVVHEALSATGRRCLIGAGWAGLGRGSMPAHWRVVDDVPHQRLFPRMAAVVHHGGSGTVANALRAGVPQVVLPLILDQHHHAHRLWQAGLTAQPVAMEDITAPQLAHAIQAAMAVPAEARQEIARRLQQSDGTGNVSTALETLVAAHETTRQTRIVKSRPSMRPAYGLAIGRA
jgi:UDP:flavonoid glycosyltransferase YjiC (YdhE family)